MAVIALWLVGSVTHAGQRLASSTPAASAAASARFWSWRLCVYQFPASTTSAVIRSKTGIITAARTIT